ncbi:MAG: DUF1549 domain-containing protein [Planctomycetota bacterium]
MMRSLVVSVAAVSAFLATLGASTLSAADPTSRINALISRAWADGGISSAPTCSDETFVRRVYLDLAGRIPSVAESRQFLADQRPERRRHLVDLLLASEDHAQHFADVFDALLMGRASESVYDQRVRHGWRGFLETVFRKNRRWDEVAREVLIARPEDKDADGSVWFLYERKEKYQAIAEAVAPAFFGIRIECAQCHDHMMVDEIKQSHYWGLVAFFNRGKNQDTPNGPRIAESAIGGFSEFANLEGSSTPNLLTFLDAPTVAEPRPGKDEKQQERDELYVPADLAGDPREPVFSRRKKFVTQILDGHPLLARAMVNRLWALLMGRGLVHPHDEIDSMHPASHPELLDWLSDDFAASGFDVRRLVGAIVLSDAYQLESTPPQESLGPETFAWYLERPLTAEQLARSAQLALRGGFQNDAHVVRVLRQQVLDVLPDAIEVPIKDALFFSNNNAFDRFVRESRGEGQLLQQLLECESHEQRARQLVESVFNRPAEQDEIAAIEGYLAQRGDRLDAAIAEIAWSILTSAEFRFNH